MADPQRAPARSAIERMLRPRSIAIVGASPSPGSLGASLLANLERFTFGGDIHLVNARHAQIDGRPCVTSTRALPVGVDCAVLAIPRVSILDAVAGCAERGVGGVVIYAAGFAEAGPDGAALQAELARIAGLHGMAVAGPNCLGHINFVDGIPLTFSSCAPVPAAGRRSIGVVSQSGAMATVLRAALHAREVALSYSISTGNEALNGIEDFLEHLIDDPATHVLLMMVEQFRQPRRFLALARRARERGKPIVLLHPGRSAAARNSAKTHTGAMSGNHAVMRTVVSHAGVALVDTLEELIDLGELMVRWPSLPRGGAAVISDSGAFKALAYDFCETSALALPEPADATKAILGAIAPDLIQPTNPLDVTAQSLVDPELYRKTMKPLLDDDRFGSVVLAVVLSSETHSRRKMIPIIAALEDFGPPKPVVFAMLGEDSEVAPEIITRLRSLGVPFFRSPERALRALARLAALRPQQLASAAAPAVEPAHGRLHAGVIPEYRAKRFLAEIGIPIPRGELARDIPAAQAVAARIGYPVALKAQASALTHKSDVGGVILGIAGEAALAERWRQMQDNIARAGVSADGILVEAMAPAGIEMIVGARRDPDWGPVVMVGLGGIWIEALDDVRLMPAELSRAGIIGEIGQLKAAPLLLGARGRAAADVDALADIVLRIAAAMRARPEISEIDINPLIVFANGEGAIALDASIVATQA
jgi:acyl-CoA synthetase (NDP forming)